MRHRNASPLLIQPKPAPDVPGKGLLGPLAVGSRDSHSSRPWHGGCWPPSPFRPAEDAASGKRDLSTNAPEGKPDLGPELGHSIRRPGCPRRLGPEPPSRAHRAASAKLRGSAGHGLRRAGSLDGRNWLGPARFPLRPVDLSLAVPGIALFGYLFPVHRLQHTVRRTAALRSPPTRFASSAAEGYSSVGSSVFHPAFRQSGHLFTHSRYRMVSHSVPACQKLYLWDQVSRVEFT
jgi:hypothetical protein